MTDADDTIVAVDLFAGAGGFSEGLRQACERLGYDLRHAAINHWQPAIDTHARNHPDAVQYHSKVEQLYPPDVVAEITDTEPSAVQAGDVEVDLLLAGPECTHFSSARGGKPVSEQKRMSPWHVLDWLEKLGVEAFIIENVKEIQSWGPVEDGQPSRDGTVFEAWINALNQLGYSVEWTQLTAADFGDPTTRERFFLVGRQTGKATFPDPTHDDSDPDKPDRRTAAEIIDWSDPGTSIWTRDLTEPRIHSPPKDTTMQRIAEGLRRHCTGLDGYADVLETLGREEIRALRRDRVVPQRYAGAAAAALEEPFLVPVDDGAVLATPTVLRQQDGGLPWSVANPMPTIPSGGGHAIATPATTLVMPKNYPQRGIHSNPLYPPADRPFHTVTSDPRAKLVRAHLTPLYNGRAGQRPRTRSIDRPLMTVPASKSPAGVSVPELAFIDDYEGPAQSLANPLGTLTKRDRFALVVPDLYPWGLDIKYRMLQPRELKQAQGFPADYRIVGSKEDRKKQIGNAVPVGLASALVEHVLTADDPSLGTFGGGVRADPDAEVPEYEEVVGDD